MPGGGLLLVMPSLKADGSLRPETRVKPRSLLGGSSTLLFWWRKKAGTAAYRGLMPARSAMPGPREVEGGGSRSGDIAELGGRAWWPCWLLRLYHRRRTIATKRMTARPAAPPTTPPAIVPAGGVGVPPLWWSAALLVLLVAVVGVP